MKVLLVNGSPNERCTFTALSEVASALNDEGVETEIVSIGKQPVRGCLGCGGCGKQGNKRCAFDDDVVNRILDKVEEADGYIFGTPVYYAGANGALLAVMDRVFYAGSSMMAGKPAAAVASARRAGTTPAIDQVNKYFQFNQMPVVSSNYWPMVHGTCVEDVLKDEEGLQIMRILGRNMAFELKARAAAAAAGVERPAPEQKIKTNFIR